MTKCKVCLSEFTKRSMTHKCCLPECDEIYKKDLIKSKVKVAKKRHFKSSTRKMTPIRKAAKGQECTLKFDCCNHDTSTTVLCHSNRLEDGKGIGLKAPDTCAAFGCSACHDQLDGRAPRPDGFTYEMMMAQFDEAVALTHVILKRMGVL